MSDEMKSHWASVYLPAKLRPAFEYHGPWWISGETMPTDDEDELSFAYTICAWVMATSEDAAIETMRLAIDEDKRPTSLEVRFSSQKERADSDRFGAAGWMKWPWPVKPLEPRP